MSKTQDPMEAFYARYEKDWKEATAKFIVVAEDRTPDYSVQYLDAEAGTGSRYTVVVSRLGTAAAAAIGANLLISVLHPQQAAYPVFADGPDDLSDNYLIEKFCRGSHGGDHAALCLTIREAVRWLNTPLDPTEVRPIGPGRWAIRGYDVLQTGHTYQVWRDGELHATAPGMLEVRQFIDNQTAKG